MDKKLMANELVAVAKDILAIEFPTQDALDKYLKNHPAADKAKHKVKETQKDAPAKDKPEQKDEKEQKVVEHEGKTYKFNESTKRWHDEKGEPVGNQGLNDTLNKKQKTDGKGTDDSQKAPAKVEPAKPEEETEDFGSQKDYVLTVRKQFSDATGGKNVKDVLKQNDEMHNWAASDESPDWDTTEPVMDSVWKGYLKSDPDSIAKGANLIVKSGKYSHEDVATQLELGKARANAVLELAKAGKDMLGNTLSESNKQYVIDHKTDIVKEWDEAIKLFGKGKKEAPKEEPAKPEPTTKEPVKEGPTKPEEVPVKPEAPAKPESKEPEAKPATGDQKSAQFDKFEINMSNEQAESISQGGKDAMPAVKELLKDPTVRKQLDALSPDDIRSELKEYGAWDDDELADDEANKQRILWIAGGNISEDRDGESVGGSDHPDMPLKNHVKAKINSNSLVKVSDVMKANGLTGGEDELQELAGFKKTLGQRVPEGDSSKYYVRNAQKLKKDFLANMDPANYKDAQAFATAKARMQKMPVEDFAKVLAAITDEDEAITGAIVDKKFVANEMVRIAKDLMA
jgi:hypothetical protein